MSNLEELKEMETHLGQVVDSVPTTAFDGASMLNIILSTYLPSIAKSLAVIADKMCEEDKED